MDDILKWWYFGRNNSSMWIDMLLLFFLSSISGCFKPVNGAIVLDNKWAKKI